MVVLAPSDLTYSITGSSNGWKKWAGDAPEALDTRCAEYKGWTVVIKFSSASRGLVYSFARSSELGEDMCLVEESGNRRSAISFTVGTGDLMLTNLSNLMKFAEEEFKRIYEGGVLVKNPYVGEGWPKPGEKRGQISFDPAGKKVKEYLNKIIEDGKKALPGVIGGDFVDSAGKFSGKKYSGEVKLSDVVNLDEAYKALLDGKTVILDKKYRSNTRYVPDRKPEPVPIPAPASVAEKKSESWFQRLFSNNR
ncbi:MAG: hypothetical protein FWD15_00690 [Alphaproteobacteria bacterium]|nr:hypothetical protein [Alphaproteobacteria bacterium]